MSNALLYLDAKLARIATCPFCRRPATSASLDGNGVVDMRFWCDDHRPDNALTIATLNDLTGDDDE